MTHDTAQPSLQPFVNSLGLTMVPLAPGEYRRGSDRGEWDEAPTHLVTLTQPFYLAATPVTNAQYEAFDPSHRALRGCHGLSRDDDEAVLFVTWWQAVAFCEWLAHEEGREYRLPTEAEWEYACRAGTMTRFSTGPELPPEYHRAQAFDWYPQPVPLVVGQQPPNPWGLHDMHGLVEEWCLDGYGPYPSDAVVDPVGDPAELRVTRGGSHNTELDYLRSANRGAAYPDDAHWLLGFRLALGPAPATPPARQAPPPRWAHAVSTAPVTWPEPSDRPLWQPPRRYVLIDEGADGPLFGQHNHCPAITWCANGDLLACWFTCRTECGREMNIAASRLRWGANEWEPADVFLAVADRNMTGSALFHHPDGSLWHFNGLEAGHGWAQLALIARVSQDHGVTWTSRFIDRRHRPHNQVIANVVQTSTGRLLLCCDAVWSGNGGTAVHLSDDGGQSWRDPSEGQPPPRFAARAKGSWIAGIHGALAELADGSLLAYGRGDSIDERMPASRSTDGGETWTYEASPWPPLSGGQRLVLLRLAEGPLLFCSFTDPSGAREPVGLPTIDAAGQPRTIHGLFAAVSYDDGQTWPVIRSLTPGAGSGELDGGAWTGIFQPSATQAEPRGYLACTQSPDGIIHLVSSALYYHFNLAWLEQPMPAE